MPFGTFSIISYKAKIDAKLAGGISIGKVLEIWAATNQHGVGISGTIFFKGHLAPGALGSFKKVTPFDSKFTVYLPKLFRRHLCHRQHGEASLHDVLLGSDF